MYFARFFQCPETVDWVTPKDFAASVMVVLFSWMASIASRTNSKLSFFHFKWVSGSLNRVHQARLFRAVWSMFSDWVVHSRFPRLLLARSKSMWFTCTCPIPAGGRKASATSLWTECFLRVADWSNRVTRKYPFLVVSGDKRRPFTHLGLPETVTHLSSDLTWPKSLTSYRPLHLPTGFQTSGVTVGPSSGIDRQPCGSTPLLADLWFSTTPVAFRLRAPVGIG